MALLDWLERPATVATVATGKARRAPTVAKVATVATGEGANVGLPVRTLDLEAYRELWLERAAIMEYDGGLPRAEAEVAALGDTLRAFQTYLQSRLPCHGHATASDT